MSSPRKNTGHGRRQKSPSGWTCIVLIVVSVIVVLGLLFYSWKLGRNYETRGAELLIFSFVVLFLFFVHGAIFFRGLALLSNQAALGFHYLGETFKTVAAWLENLLRYLSR